MVTISVFLGFSGSSADKEPACKVGDLGLISQLGRSGGGHDNPLQYSCLENPYGQRSLVSYNPWGPKELDKIERLSTAQYHGIYTFYLFDYVPLRILISVQ